MDFSSDYNVSALAKSASGNIYYASNLNIYEYNPNTLYKKFLFSTTVSARKMEYDNNNNILYVLDENNLKYYQNNTAYTFSIKDLTSNYTILSFCLDCNNNSKITICYIEFNVLIKYIEFYTYISPTNYTRTRKFSYSNNIIIYDMVTSVATYSVDNTLNLYLRGEENSIFNLYQCLPAPSATLTLINSDLNIQHIRACPIGLFIIYKSPTTNVFEPIFYKSYSPSGFTRSNYLDTSSLNLSVINPLLNSCFDNSNNLYICGQFYGTYLSDTYFSNSNIVRYPITWANAVSSNSALIVQPVSMSGVSDVVTNIVSDNNNNIYICTGGSYVSSNIYQRYNLYYLGIYNPVTNTIGKNCYDIIHNNNFTTNPITLYNYLIPVLTKIKATYTNNIQILSDFNTYITNYGTLFGTDVITNIPYNLISNFITPSSDISSNNPVNIKFALQTVLSPSGYLQADLGTIIGSNIYYFPINTSNPLYCRINRIDYSAIAWSSNQNTLYYQNSSCSLGGSITINPITFASITFSGAGVPENCSLLKITSNLDTTFRTNGIVKVIKADSLGNIYIGGSFTLVGTSTLANNIACYNINTNSWNRLNGGVGSYTTFNGQNYEPVVNAIAIDSSNNVYVGGIFSIAYEAASSGASAQGFAKWNGSFWSVPNVIDFSFSASNPEILAIAVDTRGIVYIGGSFIIRNNNITIYNLAKYDQYNNPSSGWTMVGNGVYPGLVDNISTGTIYCIAFNNNGIMFVGGHNFRIIASAYSGYYTSIAYVSSPNQFSPANANAYESYEYAFSAPSNISSSNLLLDGPITSIVFNSYNNLFCTLTNYSRSSNCELYYIYNWFANALLPYNPQPNGTNVYLLNTISTAIPIYPTNTNLSRYYKPNALFFDSSNNLYVGSQFPSSALIPTVDIFKLVISYNLDNQYPIITDNYIIPTVYGVGSNGPSFSYATDAIYAMCYKNNKIYIGGVIPGLNNICCIDISLNSLSPAYNTQSPQNMSFTLVQNTTENPNVGLQLNTYLPDNYIYSYYLSQLPQTSTLISNVSPQYLPYNIKLNNNTIYYVNNNLLTHVESSSIITDSFKYWINDSFINTSTATVSLNIIPAIVASNVNLSLNVGSAADKIRIYLNGVPYLNTDYYYYTIKSYPLKGTLVDLSNNTLAKNNVPIDISNNLGLFYVPDYTLTGSNRPASISFTYTATEIYIRNGTNHSVSNLKTVSVSLKYPPSVLQVTHVVPFFTIQQITLNGTDSNYTLTFSIISYPSSGELYLDASNNTILTANQLPYTLSNHTNILWYKTNLDASSNTDSFQYSVNNTYFVITETQQININYPPLTQNQSLSVQNSKRTLINLTQTIDSNLKYYIVDLPTNGYLYDVLDLSDQITTNSSYYTGGLSSSNIYYIGTDDDTFTYKILNTSSQLYSESNKNGIITLTNKEEPSVSNISGVVFEGQVLQISLFRSSDQNMYFRIYSLPTNGSLYYDSSLITQDDITNNTNFPNNIFEYYLNNNNNNNTDSFIYYAYDSDINANSTNGTVSIVIHRLPTIQIPPFTIVNRNQLNQIILDGSYNNPFVNNLNYYIISLDYGTLYYNNNNTEPYIVFDSEPLNNLLSSNTLYYLPDPSIGSNTRPQLTYYVSYNIGTTIMNSANSTITIDVNTASNIITNNYIAKIDTNNYFLLCDLSENITGSNHTYYITTLPTYGNLYDNLSNPPIVNNQSLESSIVYYQPNSSSVGSAIIDDTFIFTFTDSIFAPINAEIKIYYPPITQNLTYPVQHDLFTLISLTQPPNTNLKYYITNLPSDGGELYDVSDQQNPLILANLNNSLSSCNIYYYGASDETFTYKVLDPATDLYSLTDGIITINNKDTPSVINENIIVIDTVPYRKELYRSDSALPIIISSLPEYGSLTYDGSLNPLSSADEGFTEFSGNGFTYDAASDQLSSNILTDSFSYFIRDSEINLDSASGTINITIHRKPFSPDDNITVQRNQLTEINLYALINDYPDNSLNYYIASLSSGLIFYTNSSTGDYIRLSNSNTDTQLSSNIIYYLPPTDINPPITSATLVYYLKDPIADLPVLKSTPGTINITIDASRNIITNEYIAKVDANFVFLLCDLSANITGSDLKYYITTFPNNNGTLIDPSGDILLDSNNNTTHLATSLVKYSPNLLINPKPTSDTFAYSFDNSIFEPLIAHITIQYPPLTQNISYMVQTKKTTRISLTQNQDSNLKYYLISLPTDGKLYDIADPDNQITINSSYYTNGLSSNSVYYTSIDTAGSESFSYKILDTFTGLYSDINSPGNITLLNKIDPSVGNLQLDAYETQNLAITNINRSDETFPYIFITLPLYGLLYYNYNGGQNQILLGQGDVSNIDSSFINNDFTYIMFNNTNTNIDSFSYYIHDPDINIDSNIGTVSITLHKIPTTNDLNINNVGRNILKEIILDGINNDSPNDPLNYYIATLDSGTIYSTNSNTGIPLTLSTDLIEIPINNNNNTIYYLPPQDLSINTANLTYYVRTPDHPAIKSNVSTVSINLTQDQNLVNNNYTIKHNSSFVSLMCDLSANITGTNLRYIITNLPSNGKLYDSQNNEITNINQELLPSMSSIVYYIPNVSNSGPNPTSDLFAFNFIDSIYAQITATISIEYPPVAQNRSLPVQYNTTVSIYLGSADNNFKYYITVLPNNGGHLYTIDNNTEITIDNLDTDIGSNNIKYIGISDEMFSYKIFDTYTQMYSDTDGIITLTNKQEPSVIDISLNASVGNPRLITLYRSGNDLPFVFASLPVYGNLLYDSSLTPITSQDIGNTNFLINNFTYETNELFNNSDLSDTFSYYIVDNDINVSSNIASVRIFLHEIPGVPANGVFQVDAMHNRLTEIILYSTNDSGNVLNYYIESLDHGLLFYENVSNGTPITISNSNSNLLSSNRLYYLPPNFNSNISEAQLSYYIKDMSDPIFLTSSIGQIAINFDTSANLITRNYTAQITSNFLLLPCVLSPNMPESGLEHIITNMPTYGNLYINNSIISQNTPFNSATVDYVLLPDLGFKPPNDVFKFNFVGSIFEPIIAQIKLDYPPITENKTYPVQYNTSTKIFLYETSNLNTNFRFYIVDLPSNGGKIYDIANPSVELTLANINNSLSEPSVFYIGVSDETFSYKIYDLTTQLYSENTLNGIITLRNKSVPFVIDLSFNAYETISPVQIILYRSPDTLPFKFNSIPTYGSLYYNTDQLIDTAAVNSQFEFQDNNFTYYLPVQINSSNLLDTFSYFITEPNINVNSNIGNVNIVIHRKPIANNISINAGRNQLTQIDLSGTYIDSPTTHLNYYISSATNGLLYYNTNNNGIPISLPTQSPLISNKIYYMPSFDSNIKTAQITYLVEDSVENILSESGFIDITISDVPNIATNDYIIKVDAGYLSCDLSVNIEGNEHTYIITELPTVGYLVDPFDNTNITEINYILKTAYVNYVPDITSSATMDHFSFTFEGSIYEPKIANINIKYPPLAFSDTYNNVLPATSIEITLRSDYIEDVPHLSIISLPNYGTIYTDAANLVPYGELNTELLNNTIWYKTNSNYHPTGYNTISDSFTYSVYDNYFTNISALITLNIIPKPIPTNINTEAIAHKLKQINLIQNTSEFDPNFSFSYIIKSLPTKEGLLYLDNLLATRITQNMLPYTLPSESTVVYYDGSESEYFTYGILASHDSVEIYSDFDASVNITVIPLDSPLLNVPFGDNMILNDVFDRIKYYINLNGEGNDVLNYIITSLPSGTLTHLDSSHIVDINDVNNGTLFSTNNFTYINTSDILTDTFTYRIRDETYNLDSSAISVAINIIYFPISYDLNYNTNEGALIQIDLSGTIVSNNNLIYYINSMPSQGQLYSNDTGSYPINFLESDLPYYINTTRFWYLTNPDSSLNESFSYYASTDITNGYVSTLSNVNINIIHKPHVKNTITQVSTNYNQPIEIELFGLDYDDPSGNSLTYIIHNIPNNGTLFDPNNANQSINNNNYTLHGNRVIYQWLESSNIFSDANFQYFITKPSDYGPILSSSIGSYNININFKPIARDLIIEHPIHTSSITFDLSGNSQNNINPIKYQITSLPDYGMLENIDINTDLSTSSITFLDTSEIIQTTSFEYKVIDAYSNLYDTATVTINRVVNPTAYDLSIYVNVYEETHFDLSANDPNDLPLTYRINTLPVIGDLRHTTNNMATIELVDLSSIIMNKRITYTAPRDASSNYYFLYYVSNGTYSSLTARVDIFVNLYPTAIILVSDPNVPSSEINSIDINTNIYTSLGQFLITDIDTSATYSYRIIPTITSHYFSISQNVLYLEQSLLSYTDIKISIDIEVTKYNYNNQISNRSTQTFTFNIVGNIPVPCMTPDTKVLTPNGYVKITSLKKGDVITTSDNREVKIINIYKSKFRGNSKTYPYIIKKNSITADYPPKTLKLSGYHLIKYKDKDNWICPKMCGLFKQDETKKIVVYYHIELENYITDNLVVNRGTIIESMTSPGKNKIRDKLEWLKRYKNKLNKNFMLYTKIIPKKNIKN